MKCLALRCYAFYIDAFDQNPFEATVAKKMPLLCYFNFNPKFNPFSFTTKIAHGDLQAQNQTTESENEILVIFEYILEVLECFAKKHWRMRNLSIQAIFIMGTRYTATINSLVGPLKQPTLSRRWFLCNLCPKHAMNLVIGLTYLMLGLWVM